MGQSFKSPEDVCNAALTRIGFQKRISNMYDGSVGANLALNIYSQTRDEQFRLFDWGFAERDKTLDLLKTAPVGGYTPPGIWNNTYPMPPWIYEYDYPQDCIKIRSLRGSPPIIPIYDPQPIEFRIANDKTFTPAQTVVLCNLAGAIAVYTARVTDPNTWEPSFTESLIAALSRRLAPALAKAELEKFEAQDEAVETQSAEMRLG